MELHILRPDQSAIKLSAATAADIPDLVNSLMEIVGAYRRWTGAVSLVVNQNLGMSGGTGARPTMNLQVGLRFFDTTLGKPIFLKSVSPVVWVDATGAAV
jgi:hypothetical protein